MYSSIRSHTRMMHGFFIKVQSQRSRYVNIHIIRCHRRNNVIIIGGLCVRQYDVSI